MMLPSEQHEHLSRGAGENPGVAARLDNAYAQLRRYQAMKASGQFTSVDTPAVVDKEIRSWGQQARVLEHLMAPTENVCQADMFQV